MKKITVLISLLTLLGATSCKKEEKKTTANPPPPAARTWTIDGTTYTVVGANATDTAYAFGDNSGNSVNFYFEAYPTASGVYKINSNFDLDADEVDILVTTASPFMAGKPKSGTVSVTVADGKVHLKCSGVKFVKLNSASDSIGVGTLSTDVYY